jgi:hypothetical protein
MKQTGIIGVVVLALVLAGCGNGMGGGSGNINGSWTATLMSTQGTPTFAFQTSFTQGSGSNLNVVNFSFTTPGNCFASQQTTETGSFSLTGNFNGNVSGTFGMTIETTGTEKDILTLQGTVNNGKITGTWTLNGTLTSCSGNGNFTMTAS